MILKRSILFISFAGVLSLAFFVGASRPHKTVKAYTKTQVQRGSYLVNFAGGCNDCHTPKKMTPEGPVPDMDRLLSGHPASDQAPAIPSGVISPSGWGVLATLDFTSYAGPWGVSFAANLTPDSATGIGAWSEQMFVDALTHGKYWGNGRDLLPPMPWEELRNLSRSDLVSIYAYLRTIRPVNNRVPDPVPPDKAFQH